MRSVANMAGTDLQRVKQKAQGRIAAQYVHSRMIQTLENLYSKEMELYDAGRKR
jgi:hypothetical protein